MNDGVYDKDRLEKKSPFLSSLLLCASSKVFMLGVKSRCV